MEDKLTSGIVAAVANAQDTNPSELDIIIGEHIDIAAIEQLATHTDTAWTVAFELPTHTVQVTSDGAVRVDGRVETNWIAADD
ncbi:HalOD1 output domain-containing protein [Halorubrum halophilum]|uniref:HalOD1 output domain-containing protein n=1 Tax=Halorubrum halophilum TaxID=413816 RepID=UPI00186B3811|nr:HalOD1 output domain-containing protein [Halorubrum halophilum]